MSSPPYEFPVLDPSKDIKGGQFSVPWKMWLAAVNRILSTPLGGQYLSMPCGQISSSANQTLAGANTATLVTFNAGDLLSGMALTAGSGVQVQQAGVYNYQFSIQFANPTAAIQEVSIWLRKNNVDLSSTASKYGIFQQHGSVDGYLIATCNFFVTLAVGDTVTMWWAATDAAVNIEYYAAQTVPYARPAIPSAVATLSFVSSL